MSAWRWAEKANQRQACAISEETAALAGELGDDSQLVSAVDTGKVRVVVVKYSVAFQTEERIAHVRPACLSLI